MDRALEAGVTLWDTAEMYPTNPVRAETIGLSEAILGRWLASRSRPSDLIIATKAAGPRALARDGQGYEGDGIRVACEASLRRLNTDVIDLYQLHWPERSHYSFRRNWTYDPGSPDKAATLARMDEVLGTLADLRAEGKIRAAGVSNETAWGLARWNDRAEALGAPRMETIQNEYSLMNRLADTDLSETMANEGVTLMAYSPLAAGLLTGKYADGTRPPGSRLAVGDGNLGGRLSARAPAAVSAYLALAAEHGMDPIHMALAWHRTRPLASIPIFGATTLEQLDRILAGLDVTLAPDLVTAIDAVHRAHPMPY